MLKCRRHCILKYAIGNKCYKKKSWNCFKQFIFCSGLLNQLHVFQYNMSTYLEIDVKLKTINPIDT